VKEQPGRLEALLIIRASLCYWLCNLFVVESHRKSEITWWNRQAGSKLHKEEMFERHTKTNLQTTV